MKEVQFRDLKIGENYFIQKAPLRIGGKGRAKGINYLGPLVKFQEIVPLNERQKNNCDVCHVTHLKPFNEGQNPGIGYKFYEITQDKLDKRRKLIDAQRLRSSLPPNLELNLKEVISEELTGAERGSLKKVRNINPMNPNNPNEKRRLLASAAENRRRQSRKGGYKNKKKSKKNKKYNRNKATMKTKLKNKRKTRTKK